MELDYNSLFRLRVTTLNNNNNNNNNNNVY